jgi:hypothetical protein
MGLNATAKNTMLNALTATATHLGLITALSDTAPTEVTGGTPAYARKAATAWTAAASGASSAPSVQVIFDCPAAASIPVVGIGIWTAVTGGSFLGWFGLNSTAASQGTGTVDTAGVTSNLITSAAHGLTTDNYVVVQATGAGAIPAGLTPVTQIYRVLAAGLTADAFALSLTSGGTAIDITASGEVAYTKLIPEVFNTQGTLTVAINTVTLDVNVIAG